MTNRVKKLKPLLIAGVIVQGITIASGLPWLLGITVNLFILFCVNCKELFNIITIELKKNSSFSWFKYSSILTLIFICYCALSLIFGYLSSVVQSYVFFIVMLITTLHYTIDDPKYGLWKVLLAIVFSVIIALLSFGINVTILFVLYFDVNLILILINLIVLGIIKIKLLHNMLVFIIKVQYNFFTKHMKTKSNVTSFGLVMILSVMVRWLIGIYIISPYASIQLNTNVVNFLKNCEKLVEILNA